MLDAELSQKIKRKKFEEVETAWASALEQSPRPLSWFRAVAEEMRAAKGHVKMAELLSDLVDTLALEESWEEAFEMLGENIRLAPRNRDTLAKVPEMVAARYSGRTDLEAVLDFFKVEEAEDAAKAFNNLRQWLRFEPGAAFYLFGRGLGKVSEVNLALQKIQVNFEKTAPLVVRRDEAVRLLTWIPPDHFMARRLEDPEGVVAEAKADPGSFIRSLLVRFGRPLTSSEIRECMTGIVEGNRWNTWWTKAKSHPQVLPSREKKNAFQWSDSSEEAEKTILADFAKADLEDKIALARKHLRRSGPVKDGVISGMSEELDRIAASGSADAVELYLLLDEFGVRPDPAPLDLEDVLRAVDAAEVLSAIRDRRYRERLYARVPELREDDWPQVLRDLFFAENDFRLMSWIYEQLRDRGPERAAEKLVAESASSPRKTPRAFVWVTKNALTREELSERANHGLVSKIIDALDNVEFKDLKTHLREHFDEGGVAFVVFEKSDRAGVDRLLSLIDSAAGLEEHRKTDIRRAIFRKYPDIRKRVDEDVIYTTADSIESRRQEFEKLVKVEIPENAEAIRVAREYGDLRENFEYHAARQKHELLNSRAAQLDEDLRKVRVIDHGSVDSSKVSIGTELELEPVAGGARRRVVILGPWDSDPDGGVYSYLSELAKGLLGNRVGDTVQVEDHDYRIVSIDVWKPASAEPSSTVPPSGS